MCSVSPAVSPGGRPVYLGFPSIVLCVLYPQLYLLVEGQCIYRGSIADSHQLFCVFCIPSCISWWRASVSIVVVCSVSPAVSPGGGPVYLCVLYPQLYLLVEGQCIYRGSIAALLPYFESQGLVCPNYHNPADYGEVFETFFYRYPLSYLDGESMVVNPPSVVFKLLCCHCIWLDIDGHHLSSGAFSFSI